ncbi:hypothetical protein ACN28E_03060 [Archangium lansingense]|uniref:hypothetical protein n=1 Tax=Archangium lansingense TaxID=2995310 RepID=UPI003B793CBF
MRWNTPGADKAWLDELLEDAWLDEFLGEDLELEAFDEARRGGERGGDSFIRVITQIARGLVTTTPGTVSPVPIPQWNPVGPPPSPPPVAHGEITTYGNEARGHGQLTVHGTVGWVPSQGSAVPPPRGNRGLATVNPKGSITWTVYAPDMRRILYRQLIAPEGTIPEQEARDPRFAQRRENIVRGVLNRLRTSTGRPQQLRPHPASAPGPDILPRASRPQRRGGARPARRVH